jgi:hypothetical protein
MQALPLAPQLPSDGGVQVLPAQQPLAQLRRQLAQLPPEQVPPAPQSEHADPPAPHALAAVPVWQTFPWQQPLQLAALQMQAPATQARPGPHAGPLPHVQAPAAQPSAFSASHALQAAPDAPQVVVESVLQMLPEQQPLAHEVAPHTHAPPTHRCPAPHEGPVPQAHAPPLQVSALVASQVAQPPPAVPHALTVGAVHTLPAQQPLGHEVASHTHAPPTHRCPAPHGAPAPHTHAPFLHVSAFCGSHAPHAPPAPPHADADGEVTQVFPWQHPAQVVAHPAQLPATQASPAAQA